MTKYLILITILVLLYLYWKYQQNQSSSPKPDEIIERKGKSKELFDEAEDFDLSSDDSDSEEENQTFNEPKSVKLPSAKFVPVDSNVNQEVNQWTNDDLNQTTKAKK